MDEKTRRELKFFKASQPRIATLIEQHDSDITEMRAALIELAATVARSKTVSERTKAFLKSE